MRKQLLVIAILLLMPLTSFAEDLEFAVGDAVTTPGHYNGVVEDASPDGGIVTVRVNGVVYEYDPDELSRPISCFADLFCAGDIVITPGRYTATVIQPFPDGIIRARVGDGEVIYDYYFAELSKPITCLDGICVGDKVLTPGRYTATVLEVHRDRIVIVRIGDVIYNYYVSELSKKQQGLQVSR